MEKPLMWFILLKKIKLSKAFIAKFMSDNGVKIIIVAA